jgi:hypothetical protein
MQGMPTKENLTRENAWLEVRASLKIAITLQRRHFARTFHQAIEFTQVSYFFFPHHASPYGLRVAQPKRSP